MREMKVRLGSFQDVRELVNLASSVEYPVMIGDGEKAVNAKSIMCMFSLNFRRPALLLLDCDEDDFEAFRFKAARFEVVE